MSDLGPVTNVSMPFFMYCMVPLYRASPGVDHFVYIKNEALAMTSHPCAPNNLLNLHNFA